MKNLHTILYNTTRGIFNLEDKVDIASLILFCKKRGSKTFARLLYTKNYGELVRDLQEEFKASGIEFNIRLNRDEVSKALIDTIEKLRVVEDEDRYLKALYEGDEFALVICGITENFFKKDIFYKDILNIKNCLYAQGF